MDDMINLDINLEDEGYGDIIKKMGNEDYGKKMTDELEGAVQDVMDLTYQEFSSEEGEEKIQTSLQAAEDSPEASLYDDAVRKARTGNFKIDSYLESVEQLDLDEISEEEFTYGDKDLDEFSIN
ncbi:MAG: hypothetical protein V5A72_02685 [Candidatus Nanohaloarchaea archaeon]